MNKGYIYKRRLLKLADFLEKLPKERFDFSRWVGNNWGGKSNLSCGTSACAIGWASTIPSFRKAGLVLKLNITNASVNYKFVPAMKDDNFPTPDSSFRVGLEIFGLSKYDFDNLFVPGLSCGGRLAENATPKMVANHIKNFVRQKYG